MFRSSHPVSCHHLHVAFFSGETTPVIKILFEEGKLSFEEHQFVKGYIRILIHEHAPTSITAILKLSIPWFLNNKTSHLLEIFLKAEFQK